MGLAVNLSFFICFRVCVHCFYVQVMAWNNNPKIKTSNDNLEGTKLSTEAQSLKTKYTEPIIYRFLHKKVFLIKRGHTVFSSERVIVFWPGSLCQSGASVHGPFEVVLSFTRTVTEPTPPVRYKRFSLGQQILIYGPFYYTKIPKMLPLYNRTENCVQLYVDRFK